MESGDEKLKNLDLVLDLSKDDLLAQLKWKSRKRRHTGRSSVCNQHYPDHGGKKHLKSHWVQEIQHFCRGNRISFNAFSVKPKQGQ